MFSERVKELRKKMGLSQVQFAEAIQSKQATIAGWERGTREPGFTTVTKLAQFFCVSTDYLLGHSDEERPTAAQNSDPATEFDAKALISEIREVLSEQQVLLAGHANKSATQSGQPTSERDITMAKIAARLNEMNDKEFSRAVEIFRLLDSE
ncbi:MAG: helix-turn-helix domain-containing protein [Oscillospiraceae bacterium]|jgi:transcriptional regulator with XRE-family HTH domain|nr:helix-turn-helix domain-containing protein [Oscillospiraceae bacterium]